MAARYRLFPPIGIARLGEDPDFFLGPELPGSGPGELQANGATVPTMRFKDVLRKKIRKQGARFHLFESDDGQNWQPANLPATATVTWTVTLTNKKSAVKRGGLPPIKPERPQIPAATAGQVIEGGTRAGTTCFRSSSHFAASANSNIVNPVRLPPGWLSRGTRPLPAGSMTSANTTGTVPVAPCSAFATSELPAMIASG